MLKTIKATILVLESWIKFLLQKEVEEERSIEAMLEILHVGF